MDRARVVILGAAGRDFHNFNCVYRDDPGSEVVAFTAAQIPGIAGRRYPAALAGPLYPEGIPIVDEASLDAFLRRERIGEVNFAYSDLSHAAVMHLASRALAAGADFLLLGPARTMLRAGVPVIAVSAVRTGCGKSQTARWIAGRLSERGLRIAVIRHPMPYGDLASAAVQRFATRADLDAARCTLEEREEFEPHLALGQVVYTGVDMARVIALAEREADVILWEGGNNDFPFVRPDLHLALADALRPGQEAAYHPGETVLRMADVILIAKSDAAPAADVERVLRAIEALNPGARVIRVASPVTLDAPSEVRGRRVLVIEDGPTLTHGGMATGAGYRAAVKAGAREIIDARPHAAPRLAQAYAAYPHMGPVLPALGYSAEDLAALRETILRCGAEVIVSATPCDLSSLLGVGPRIVRARYELAEAEDPGLGGVLEEFLLRVPARR
jgi:predicted GTPase